MLRKNPIADLHGEMLPPAPVSQEEMQARFPWMRPGAVRATPIVPSVFGTRETIGRSPSSNPLFEHCAFRGVMSFVMGGAMGFVFGGLMTTYERTEPFRGLPGQVDTSNMPMREALKDGLKQMKVKGKAWAKNFAVVGGIFATIECEIEGRRGKHDLTNSVAAGCATGAGLAYKSGPAGMCLGCAGFAAFSVVIDSFMTTEY